MRPLAALLGLAALAAGCGQAKCANDTILLTVQFADAAANADAILVSVQVNGGTAMATSLPHHPGNDSGRVEIDFPHGYPRGASVSIQVAASTAGTMIANGSTSGQLDGQCAAWNVSLSACTSSDCSSGGGSTDMATPASGSDLSMSAPGDMAQAANTDMALPGSDMALPGWQLTTAMTGTATTNEQFGTAVYNGFMYVVVDGVSIYAPIQSDGSLGSWTTTTVPSMQRDRNSIVALNGYLYVLGGWSGSAAMADVQVAKINADGSVGTWSTTTSFATPRYLHAAVATGGRIYVVGGVSQTNQYLTDIQMATPNADGTISSWSHAGDMLTGRCNFPVAVANSRIYAVGGEVMTQQLTPNVEFAPINANGTIGTFTATVPLPVARGSHAAEATSTRLAVAGGWLSYGGTGVTSTLTAVFNADGTIGSWNSSWPLLLATRSPSHTMAGRTMYVLGGSGPDSSTSKHVEYISFDALASPGPVAVSFINPTANAIVSGNQVTKATASQTGDGYDCGAISSQTINGDGGFVEWTFYNPNSGNERIFGGLCKSDNHGGYIPINFAIAATSTGSANVYESGTVVPPDGLVSSMYSQSDVMHVGIEGGKIVYRLNSVLKYTSSVTPTFPLFFCTSINNQTGAGAGVKNVVILAN